MDILLTHGYFLLEDAIEKEVMKPYPTLGLLYISAYLKSCGFDVEVLDSTFQSREAVLHTLACDRPPVVGIYCNLMTKPNVLALITACKQFEATVILGGPEPHNYAEEYLRFGADIIVIGEAELTLRDLLPHLSEKGLTKLDEISGIVFMDMNEEVVTTEPRPLHPNLDDFPFPDRQAIDMAKYLDTWKVYHDMSAVSLITARGCPYTCTWCSHSVYGVSHRRRSVDNVIQEVELIREAYAPDMLWYADDVFTIHTRWFFEYAAALKRCNLNIPFECISREDRLNEDVIRTLAEMGCFRLWIGSESGSQRVLDAMQRRTNAERVREMTKLLQKYGIQAGMFIMLGYEGETEADLALTVEHLKQANPDIFLTTVSYPIKGTEYYRQVAERVQAKKPWAQRTDRDLIVEGRHSKRFYQHANRWMVNEVNCHRQWQAAERNYPGILRSYLYAKLGRIGMNWSSW